MEGAGVSCPVSRGVCRRFEGGFGTAGIFRYRERCIRLCGLKCTLLSEVRGYTKCIGTRAVPPGSRRRFVLLVICNSVIMSTAGLILRLLGMRGPCARSTRVACDCFTSVYRRGDLVLSSKGVPASSGM